MYSQAGRRCRRDRARCSRIGLDPCRWRARGRSDGLVGDLGREPFQHDALQAVVDECDEIVVDTPTNLGLLTVNALVCTGRVLALPVSMSELG